MRPWCEARRRGVCSGRARWIHHRRLVKQRGAKMLPANTMAVCFECHHWIHHNVSQARVLGWLVSSKDEEFAELGEIQVAKAAWLIGLVVAATGLLAVFGVCALVVLVVLFAWQEGAW